MQGELKEVFEKLDVEVDLDFDGKEVKVKVHTDISVVDGAMVGILQGDTGARCHYCSANRAQCNSLVEILNGFYITKSLEECQRVWDMLENGTMDWDDPARGGQCHEPLHW